MIVNILTLFPEMFTIFDYSILGRAAKQGIIQINTHNIRDYTKNKHKKTDDYPYGGGAGMVMTAQPIIDAIRAVKSKPNTKVIFLGPKGQTFNQKLALELSNEEELIFLCGHYEGIDERIYKYIDMEVSLGDFILTGGEMACIPIVDSICRLIPEVLSSSESLTEESFYDGTLEYPQYTRPEIFEGERVPEILLSGHHEKIRMWRRQQSLFITKGIRKDLFSKLKLSAEDRKLLNQK